MRRIRLRRRSSTHVYMHVDVRKRMQWESAYTVARAENDHWHATVELRGRFLRSSDDADEVINRQTLCKVFGAER
jgi:hypothetical protein